MYDNVLPTDKVQIYLDELEAWMRKWRLKLAPHKCVQITFSRSRLSESDCLNIKLNGVQLPYEKSPKFLGVKFDRLLNFSHQIEHIDTKITERLNLLKALTHNKTWSLPESILVQLYKSLLRSVIDYSSFIIAGLNKDLRDKLEVFQNEALRTIFKIKKIDKVHITTLRERAKVDSIETRLKNLLIAYFEKAKENPLIITLISEYWSFRKRNVKSSPGSDEYNEEIKNIHKTSEKKWPTILCFINNQEISSNQNENRG